MPCRNLAGPCRDGHFAVHDAARVQESGAVGSLDCGAAAGWAMTGPHFRCARCTPRGRASVPYDSASIRSDHGGRGQCRGASGRRMRPRDPTAFGRGGMPRANFAFAERLHPVLRLNGCGSIDHAISSLHRLPEVRCWATGGRGQLWSMRADRRCRLALRIFAQATMLGAATARWAGGHPVRTLRCVACAANGSPIAMPARPQFPAGTGSRACGPHGAAAS